MSKLNTKKEPLRTHEGGVACRISPEQQLRRSVMSCMLWEDTFYEDGESIADRLSSLAQTVSASVLASTAMEARKEANLRHVPLLLCRELLRHPNRNTVHVSNVINEVINRPDEMGELLAIYNKDGRSPLASQLKKGLAKAFKKFDEYQLAKYNRDAEYKLKDVLFLSHPKPENKSQQDMWDRLVSDSLKTPDTWEVGLSTGGDKKETFTRLLSEHKLGALAILRNMRNMHESGVKKSLVKETLFEHRGLSKVLPFRFVAAARACPQWEDIIDQTMLESLSKMERLDGKTIILVDVSGSMDVKLSLKSDLKRVDAAAALAALVRGISDEAEIFTFNSSTRPAPPRNGMGLVDCITSRLGGGTNLGFAVRKMMGLDYDRLIVITDEQSRSSVPHPKQGKNYMINVASYKNGVGYGTWTHIDGFSESVLKWIQEYEKLEGQV